MRSWLLLLAAMIWLQTATAQYAPQVGLSGCMALADTSMLFEGWATQCTVIRGYMNIADTSLGLASAGVDTNALGPPDDNTVSLGDSGMAVVSFFSAIYDADGPDFAVFENGFMNPDNDTQAFLELGFVEVSSDSIHFIRFPSASLTQTHTQITNDDYLYANQLNNLAGNYVAWYGTPFDLQELADSPNLDISNVRWVRIIDVVGDITGHTTRDANGRAINDPFPTPFPSCGFDLDAVGAIHQKVRAAVTNVANDLNISLYPNPVSNILNIDLKHPENGISILITSVTGTTMLQQPLSGTHTAIDVQKLPSGMYYWYVVNNDGNKWFGKLIKE